MWSLSYSVFLEAVPESCWFNSSVVLKTECCDCVLFEFNILICASNWNWHLIPVLLIHSLCNNALVFCLLLISCVLLVIWMMLLLPTLTSSCIILLCFFSIPPWSYYLLLLQLQWRIWWKDGSTKNQTAVLFEFPNSSQLCLCDHNHSLTLTTCLLL